MTKKPSKKNITLDELAGMTQREFSTVRSEMHDGFEGLQKQINELRQEMYRGFKEMREGFAQVRQAISDLTLSIKVLSSELTEMKARQDDHERRIRRLEQAAGLAK
jgi:chromosome segregation ATPase